MMESPYQDLDRYQDVLGQLPILQAYTQGVYFFPLADGVTHGQVVSDVDRAITKVRTELPWMGGRVINVGRGPGDSGMYRVAACSSPPPALVAVDVSSIFPSYSEFQSRKAPLSLIQNGQVLTTVPGYPHKVDVDSEEDPALVVRVQVNFVTGGVLLSLSTQHNTADAGGFFVLVQALAMAMRGETFPSAFLEAVNRDRRNAVPLLGPNDKPPLDHSNQLRPPVTAANPLAVAPLSSPAHNHIIRFTPAAMAHIKALASAADGFDPSVRFISTDDAICAFYWQRLTRARANRIPPGTKQARFTRQMDGRALVGLPPDYPGVVSHTAICALPVSTLLEAPLSTVASAMRKALNEANNAHHLRSAATFIANTKDKSTITYTGKFDPQVDVGSSSWRSFGSAAAFPEFGVLGKPEFLRRPPTLPFAGTIMLFPAADGSCDANACLTDEDLEALRGDLEWEAVVEYIG
ncbi:transferase family-domain-containing protein [Podospora didyma]|uniref:Transferase family-domain-containing protein n=1 Tax=Podospora didyma TaxID=330526 RepID=A0AAE0N1M7_9PEZI|nr:transferase family-domain-containing protein [Podospora didyma]